MKICSENHNEICYEVKICPVCALKEEADFYITDLEKQIENLRDSAGRYMADLEKQIENLKEIEE